jgi:hypothetical protein
MSEAWSVTSGGTQAGSGVCSPSALMTTAGTERPLGICTVSTASTVPDTPLCADETARRAHNGTHQHRIALFHRGGARRADMLLHGQHDLFGQGHGDSGHTGCFLFMRHARAEGAAFEFG